jgi:hypothetical protein
VRREDVPIAQFIPLGPGDYMPSAMTPLRDAVAQFIGHLDRLRARAGSPSGCCWMSRARWQPTGRR